MDLLVNRNSFNQPAPCYPKLYNINITSVVLTTLNFHFSTTSHHHCMSMSIVMVFQCHRVPWKSIKWIYVFLRHAISTVISLQQRTWSTLKFTLPNSKKNNSQESIVLPLLCKHNEENNKFGHGIQFQEDLCRNQLLPMPFLHRQTWGNGSLTQIGRVCLMCCCFILLFWENRRGKVSPAGSSCK